MGNSEEHSHVDLSVRFGEGTQFGDPKGWLGNSVRRDSNGKYKLRAHVMAGNVVLKSRLTRYDFEEHPAVNQLMPQVLINLADSNGRHSVRLT